jgi:hypothetical protein
LYPFFVASLTMKLAMEGKSSLTRHPPLIRSVDRYPVVQSLR